VWPLDKKNQSKEPPLESGNPRYTGNPMLAVFENLVLDVLGRLPAGKAEILIKMDLPKVLKSRAKDWKGAVKESLHLSETIEIAILDLWYTNQEVAVQKQITLSAEEFAMGFVDNYLKENSQVDIWTQESLARAKERINLRRQGSN
jgi:hypothetical protein